MHVINTVVIMFYFLLIISVNLRVLRNVLNNLGFLFYLYKIIEYLQF